MASGLEDRRREFMRLFQQPDSIMEVWVFDKLKEYQDILRSDNDISQFVETVGDSYQGYAQMCNIVSDLLKKTGMTNDEVEQTAVDHVKHLLLGKFEAKRADEYWVKQNTEPKWLKVMIKQPVWRTALYELLERNSGSITLVFAIKRISDAGHHEEIAHYPGASSDNATVFGRVLMDTLERLSKMNELELRAAMPVLERLALVSQHAYLFTQVLLHSTEREATTMEQASISRRISQELHHRACAEGHSSLARHVQALCTGLYAYPELADAVLSILSSERVSTGDAVKIAEYFGLATSAAEEEVLAQENGVQSVEYDRLEEERVNGGGGGDGDGEQWTHADLLHDPQVLDMFTRALFDRGGEGIAARHLMNYCRVLALAAGANGRASALDIGKQLYCTYRVCHRNDLMRESLAADIDELCLLVHGAPVVAIAALMWVEHTLMAPNFLAGATSAWQTSPPHCVIIDVAAQCHQGTRDYAFAVCRRLYEADLGLEPMHAIEFHRHLLDRFLHLIALGYVTPIFDFLALARPDIALVRHFAHELLAMAAPPYAPAYVAAWARLLTASPDTLSICRSTPEFEPFCQHIHQTATLHQGLTPDERALFEMDRPVE